jgi:hypothetical protein
MGFLGPVKALDGEGERGDEGDWERVGVAEDLVCC